MDVKWPISLGIMSMILQVFSFVSPGWLRFTKIRRGFDMGLWYMCVPSCMMYGSDDYDYIYDSIQGIVNYMSSGYWLEYQIEVTVALIAGSIGILFIFGSAKRKWKNTNMFKAYAMVGFFGSGITLWVPVGRLAHFYENWGTDSPGITFPYSVVTAGIAATLALITAVLLLIDVCTKKSVQDEGIRRPLPHAAHPDRVYVSQPPSRHLNDVYLHRSPYMGPYTTK